ncbi:uncharacterized protein LOC101895836 isoform X1 [Musca domestica]|uniref:Ragulator complex protein LAMTOR1 n=1 Tax=Musca domestica TaxID=7370 RepID=A0ABM3VH33_MUSDO|nr:uncharacterized protein LOC101895836 isoform X1 [Musca domestica]XP_058985100.1 uncharacterized protein LOC101895836 isoform X1 [Musca domestica]XP_058985101.1 uncharacterized protein LOC101895836 isoform X1 [Musca domestica]
MEYFRPIWSCMSSLFCGCLHCNDDLTNQGYDPSERTHLLSDTVNNSPALRRTNSENISSDCQSVPKKDDQQNALCRLVQNTAINMIDVGAMDSHNLEHQECDVRIKLYSHRLQQQWSNIQSPSKRVKGILKDIPKPDVYLTLSVNPEDINQMTAAIERVHRALANIKIDHKEAIVVPFRIP